MKSPLTLGMMLAATIFIVVSSALGQSSEGAAMAVDSADQACLQLKDANTWTTKLGYLSGVGTIRSLATVLAGLSSAETPHYLDGTSGNVHPPVVGYNTGIRWSSADMATTAWSPQGLSTGSSGSIDFAIVSWNGPSESRVSIVDTTDLTNSHYRNIMLVNPTSAGHYEAVNLHAGGLALEGHYLYMTDFPAGGFRVFDLDQIRQVDGSNSTCGGHFGMVGTSWCADGYAYMLPQMNNYYTPATKSDGATISASCKPKFSWAGKDTRPVTHLVLSGEYCAYSASPDVDRNCRGDLSGMNGRLYQWPIGSDNKLVTSSGYVEPTQVYFMNERNVQGVAPIMTKDGSGNYQANAYWLSSTKLSGALFKVSPLFAATEWLYTNSLVPYAPEGLHSSSSGSNLWIVTEGESGVTDPSSGGRVYISLHQADID